MFKTQKESKNEGEKKENRFLVPLSVNLTLFSFANQTEPRRLVLGYR